MFPYTTEYNASAASKDAKLARILDDITVILKVIFDKLLSHGFEEIVKDDTCILNLFTKL